jgi:hypothetical protein
MDEGEDSRRSSPILIDMIAATKTTSHRRRLTRRRGACAKLSRRAVNRMLKMLKAGDDLRKRKVRRLRAAVRARRYYNEIKLSIAVDRLLADAFADPPVIC